MFEEAIANSIRVDNPNKTFIDKLLSKEDIKKLQILTEKENLNRKEILSLLHLCLSTELKLTSLSAEDRYYLGKFFVWIREQVKISSLYFEHLDYIESLPPESTIKKNKRILAFINQIQKTIEGEVKFMVDVFIYIVRSSMSIKATAFTEILKNKFELSYGQPPASSQDHERKNWFGMGGKRE
jgi:hypothetical protein